MSDLRSVLKIGKDKLDNINDFLLDPQNVLTNQLLEVVEKFGGTRRRPRMAVQKAS